MMHRTHLVGEPKQAYIQSVYEDYDTIKDHLPESVESILDIGCGLAGIDVLLADRYPGAKIYLLDGDGGQENWRGGYARKMEPFTSVAMARQVLELNGHQVEQVFPVGYPDVLQADLIISLLSWGFHYPLETYKTAGVRITDIRNGEPIPGQVIHRSRKYSRCLW